MSNTLSLNSISLWVATPASFLSRGSLTTPRLVRCWFAYPFNCVARGVSWGCGVPETLAREPGHIHAHTNSIKRDREVEEADLIANTSTPCNG